MQKLSKEYGLTDNQLEAHFSEPAFLPWQRMGNINSHQGLWMDKRDSFKKILKFI